MQYTTVNGKNNKHQIKIFTLSTCGWCKKTKKLLDSLDVRYEYIDVDKIFGDELEEVTEELEKYNPWSSYPTMIIDGGKQVIIGYKEDQIREVLG